MTTPHTSGSVTCSPTRSGRKFNGAIDDIRRLVASVDRPVNILVRPGLAPVTELAEAGVARISVGGAFNQVALAALTQASCELLDHGTYGFMDLATEGREQARAAFSPS